MLLVSSLMRFVPCGSLPTQLFGPPLRFDGEFPSGYPISILEAKWSLDVSHIYRAFVMATADTVGWTWPLNNRWTLWGKDVVY